MAFTITTDSKQAGAVAGAFVVGLAAGWLLNTYGKEKLESLLSKLQAKVKGN
jgi:hypothetical protein